VLLPTVLDVIGDTPVVDVSVLAPHPGVRLLAKLEGQNPHESANVAFDHLHRPEALT
jgi:cysteine synthase